MGAPDSPLCPLPVRQGQHAGDGPAVFFVGFQVLDDHGHFGVHGFGAGDDAAKTALRYGRAWAIIGVVMPHLERIFVIKKRDIGAELDYNVDEKMALDAHMVLTITIGRALALALRAGIGFLKIYQAYQDKNKGGAVHESSSE